MHGIVRGAITSVNPDVPAVLFASMGWTTEADGTRVPRYAPAVNASVQVQALGYRDLEMVSGLNIQGEARTVYLNGDWRGVLRPEKAGGDLLTFGGEKWLNVKTVEQWPDWSRLLVVRQVC